MNLPAGIALPNDAPAAGTCVKIERPEAGLALVRLDPPHRKMPVFDLALMRDFALALDELEADKGLRAVVIAGREPLTFVAGADVDVIASITDRALARELGRFGELLFDRVARLSVPTVAAVGGPVPGGACELALAARWIVLADDKRSRIGLPEVRLGILPGWGGSQRLPRRIGTPAALEAILTGRLYGPREALKLGLVDRLAAPENLVRIASDLALGREMPRSFKKPLPARIVDSNSLARSFVERQVRTKLERETHGHYPAPFAALELVLRATSTPLEQGLEAEADALATLAISPECKSLVTLFRLSEEAKKTKFLADGSEGKRLARIGVIGAGVMGAGIARLAAEKGVTARLSDVARAPLDAALHVHRKEVGRQLAKRRVQKHEADAALDRLELTEGLVGFDRCDLVVEAVVERLDVKQKVLGELARRMADDALLATNTSSLSVDSIAEGLPHPERVVGMHFFNPVAQMPLVEVVRGKRTADWAVAAVAKLALELGKTPVICADVPGFLVNRLLGPYLDEAARLFVAGVDPEHIDSLARDFGMPMGPLELLDEVGFDVAAHAAESLAAAYGPRMHSAKLIHDALAAGLKGKKGGAGFYLHALDPKTKKAKRGAVNPAMARFVAPGKRTIDYGEATILDQLFLTMLNEAARCLEEGVVAGPRELDLASVFGMGFAPFRGGLLRWADTLGAKDALARLRRIAGAPDVLARPEGAARFQPAMLLQTMAEHGGRFHG
ncbi:MAG: 3-hydroxyacyl-CoA dehydrogenase NAD-binding domain-containing protein [Planctomycetes bacterium]|nr:3-hydroxyacyl-CoA dehydrogenase NAD-binding domain-containing protein [Planctomycetota bacterium]